MKKPEVTKKQMEEVHPYIPEAYSLLEQGRITRREFLRTATLLGMSASVAYLAAACGGAAEEEAAAPAEAAELRKKRLLPQPRPVKKRSPAPKNPAPLVRFSVAAR